MAIQKHIVIAFGPGPGSHSRAISSHHPELGLIPITSRPERGPDGDWLNYLKGATSAVLSRWPISRGIDAAFASNLPPAAGLSSSSALLVSFALALLMANGVEPSLNELMDVLPEGEEFAGTRGGAMDHAAVLGAIPHCALRVTFAPFATEPVPIPPRWRFVVAHSLTSAEKSAALRPKYNAVRSTGTDALRKLGLSSFQAALEVQSVDLRPCSDVEARAFRHVTGEALRVTKATQALLNDDLADFGQLLCDSHCSLRDNLGVSTPVLDRLVATALEAGALGARLTGAGFGGCVLVLCEASHCAEVQAKLMQNFYSRQQNFMPDEHLFVAEPSAGALARIGDLLA